MSRRMSPRVANWRPRVRALRIKEGPTASIMRSAAKSGFPILPDELLTKPSSGPAGFVPQPWRRRIPRGRTGPLLPRLFRWNKTPGSKRRGRCRQAMKIAVGCVVLRQSARTLLVRRIVQAVWMFMRDSVLDLENHFQCFSERLKRFQVSPQLFFLRPRRTAVIPGD